ncbi:uncharacterized protein LOC117108395 [Anneissia japonica]|uniref:uncharacterized protein LOC117108395 n=1 Tax=Anneissia japonica TaxID=1529436 RepID=UPI0014259F63|nr:uncharacterized protein LOC117108395 [Anneissia japonica]
MRSHCQRKHRDEVLVAEAIAVSKLDPIRGKALWADIKNKGNFNHNLRVHEGKANDLIVRKRPKLGSEKDVNNYVPCVDCLGYFNTATLYLHAKNCPKKQSTSKQVKHVKRARMLLPINHKSEKIRAIVNTMRCGQLTLVVRGDKDILKVGEDTIECNSSRKGDLVREKMRTLAKVQARSICNKIVVARDMVKPQHFDTVVQAARNVSGYDEGRGEHQTYSLALKIGYCIADLAVIVRNQLIKEQDHKKKQEVDAFIQLRDTEWRTKITAAALKQRQTKKWKTPAILPLTEDCMAFNRFLKQREKDVKLQGNLVELAKVTLCQVIIFNRRQPTEVEMITVEDYLEKANQEKSIHDTIYESLSTTERVSLDRMTVIQVRGKRGRGVPVLLNNEMRDTSEDATTPLRASKVMTELAQQCPNLKHPENLRCTKLRKQLATLSQILGLKNHELEQLANHMGHDVRTHREYYRLLVETVLLTKMSKLLHIADSGKMHEFKGKSLEDIDVAPDEVVPSLDEDDDEVDDDEEIDEQISEKDNDYEVKTPKVISRKKSTAYNRWSTGGVIPN